MFPLVAWGQDGITGYWEDKINEAVAETDYQVIGSTYNIYTALGLAWVVDQIAGKDDCVIILRNDIDLSGYYWTPIAEFSGSFNGNRHKISNIAGKIEQNQQINAIRIEI